MIFDSLSHASQYAGLHAGIDRVLAEAEKYRADNFPTERAVLDGDALFMNFAQYDTKPVEGAPSEAHRQYIDVMVMIEGEETIYVKSTDRLQNVTTPYDASRDVLLADTDSDATPIHMTPGMFVVLFPQDAHTPGRHAAVPSHVKKIIGKVRI